MTLLGADTGDTDSADAVTADAHPAAIDTADTDPAATVSSAPETETETETELTLLQALDRSRTIIAEALSRTTMAQLSNDVVLTVAAAVESVGAIADSARVSVAADVERRSAKWLGADSLARKHGCHNGRDLITLVTRVSGSEVNRRLKLGSQVLPRQELTQALPPFFPVVADAFLAGDLGVDAAEAIVSGLGGIRSRVDPELLGAAEAALVAAATGHVSETTADLPNAGFAFDADSIRGQAALWVARLDPDGAAPNDDIYEARSNIGFGPFRKGLYPLRGGVTPELRGIIDGITNTYLSGHTETPGNGGLLPDAHLADPDSHLNLAANTASDGTASNGAGEVGSTTSLGSATAAPDSTGPAFPSAAEQAAAAERQARIDAGDEDLTGTPIPFDDRSTAEKRADILRAVIDAAARDSQTPTMGGSAPTVLLHVNARDLAEENGVGWIDGVEAPVSLRTVKQMICAGGIQTVVLGENNEILHLGTEERAFNRKQRRAMAARDGGCVIPGCDTPPAWTEGHHVIPWAICRKTDISNGVLLCWYHHHSLDTSGWEIRMVSGSPQIKAPPWLDPQRIWRPGGQHRATQSSTGFSSSGISSTSA